MSMPTDPAAPGLDLGAQVAALQWVHQIDLGGGVTTPGRWPPHPLILKAYDAVDFRGKRVLDIGAWDGLWSFEAERRGAAAVVATDDISQRHHGVATFQLAHRTLQSRVEYHPHVNVYDIEQLPLPHGFDVVVFCGVYYHLRHPLLAMAKLRRMMNPGGVMIIEGPVILNDVEAFARFYYRESFVNDPSNWWVPTQRCLREWLESSYMEVTHEFVGLTPAAPASPLKSAVKRALGKDDENVDRAVMVARAVVRKDPNYVFADPDLAPFDRDR